MPSQTRILASITALNMPLNINYNFLLVRDLFSRRCEGEDVNIYERVGVVRKYPCSRPL